MLSNGVTVTSRCDIHPNLRSSLCRDFSSPQHDEAVEDNTDYPRPQAPGEAQQEHEHGGYEEPEKHERRRAPDMRESLSHKADVNAPKLAYSASGKPQGRISQPQGKAFG